MQYTLTKESINKATGKFSSNQNFQHNLLPRLQLLYTIKKRFKNLSKLEWFFEYNHVNTKRNRVVIEYLNDSSPDFNFFYEIPLSLNFELRVFLSKSSVHFIDIYNFLLEREIIWKDQFRIKAEYHTIPHFIINKTRRYNLEIIKKYSTDKEENDELIDEIVFKELESGFAVFNPIFDIVSDQFKI